MSDLSDWIKTTLGVCPKEISLYERALTHSSHVGPTYERLEFLGDRVLGLAVAHWLYELYPEDPEGLLSTRLNALVARTSCAQVGREVGVQARMRLGKQALDDGAYDSDNVIGDVVEALIGALYLDAGEAAAATFIRHKWEPQIDGQSHAPRHPKTELQEWAAANRRKPPHYEIVERSGPDHAPRFRVRVSVGSAGDAEADGRSKQEAERAAAAALLGKLL